jgi:hypothetical protein
MATVGTSVFFFLTRPLHRGVPVSQPGLSLRLGRSEEVRGRATERRRLGAPWDQLQSGVIHALVVEAVCGASVVCGLVSGDLLGRKPHHGDLLFQALDHRTDCPSDLWSGCWASGSAGTELRLRCAWSGGGCLRAGGESPAGGVGAWCAATPGGCGCGFYELCPVM